MAYNGTTKVLSGLIPANGTAPVADAKDIYVNDSTRLDQKLSNMDAAIGEGSGNKLNSAAVAPTYSASTPYSVGNLVTHEGGFYRCNTAIATPGEEWNSAHWDVVNAQGVFMTEAAAEAAFVQKETGKSLMTDAERTKLAGIAAGATAVTVDSALTQGGTNPVQGGAIHTALATIQNMVGSPLVATTAADMTDTTRVYVYTGNETGYTNGNWYYYDGSNWTSGGVYNSAALTTDTTLTIPGAAADAKAVGDEVGSLKSALTNLSSNYAFEQKTVIPKFQRYGVLPYNGGLNTLQGDSSADTGKLYYANVSTSNKDRLMFHNGTAWQYGELYYKWQYLIDGLFSMLDARDREKKLIFDKFVNNGITAYNGTLTALAVDPATDTNKLYRAISLGANNNRLMYYDGNNWAYSALYYYYYDLTKGMHGTLSDVNKITVGCLNFGEFNVGSSEISLETYKQNYREILNDANYDFWGAIDWADYFDYEDHTIPSESAIFGDSVELISPQTASNKARGYGKGGWARVGEVAPCQIYEKNINGVPVYIYVGYYQSGVDRASTRQEQYQTILSHIASNNRKYAIVIGDFNAWSASEYDIWKNAGYHLANCGYLGEQHTLRDIPADNIICTPDILISSINFILMLCLIQIISLWLQR